VNKPITNYRSFDVAAAIHSCTSLWLRTQLFSSYAWRIDTLIVQQCRALYKRLKLTDLAMTLESDADYRNALTSADWTEQLFAEAGSDTVTPVHTLHTLVGMRLEAHEVAANAAMLTPWPNGEPRKYEIPELEALFEPSGSTEPRGQSLMRMEITAQRKASRMATGKEATALAKRLFDRRVKTEKANMAAMKHNMANQTQSLIALYSYTMALEHGETKGFVDLHIDVQRTLIDSVISAAERSEATAESRANEVSDDDFMHVIQDVEDLIDQLKGVLASPRFNGGVEPVRVRRLVANPEVTVHTEAAARTVKAKALEQKAIDDKLWAAKAEAERMEAAKQAKAAKARVTRDKKKALIAKPNEPTPVAPTVPAKPVTLKSFDELKEAMNDI
jgi:hypothetical protein